MEIGIIKKKMMQGGISVKRLGSLLAGGVFIFTAWLCMLLLIVGAVSVDCRCFAVDASGNLYLGIRDTVYVYSGDVMIRRMPMMGRACVFTIQEDNTILWADSTKVHITDLEQNVLESWKDSGSEMFYRLKGNVGGSREFTAADGTRYVKRNLLGRFRIYKESELFYEAPVTGQALLAVMVVSVVMGVICFMVYWSGGKRNDKASAAKVLD